MFHSGTRNQLFTPGVNFTNILHDAFTCADLKSAKKADDLTAFFALFGSAHLKAGCKMLVTLTPEQTIILYDKWFKKI